MAILILSIQPTEVPPTQAQPITTITTHPESSQAAPRIDKGKGIATESDKDPSKKLVSASTIVRPDPDEEVKVYYMINGKMCYFTDKEMQAYLDNLVVAASAYYVWQERNWRLFQKGKRTTDQIVECIISSVRLKLLSCKLKKSKNGKRMARLWDLPEAIFI
ncbi:hypothetical protein Tco_0695799 [Tanacetum coccineum]